MICRPSDHTAGEAAPFLDSTREGRSLLSSTRFIFSAIYRQFVCQYVCKIAAFAKIGWRYIVDYALCSAYTCSSLFTPTKSEYLSEIEQEIEHILCNCYFCVSRSFCFICISRIFFSEKLMLFCQIYRTKSRKKV